MCGSVGEGKLVGGRCGRRCMCASWVLRAAAAAARGLWRRNAGGVREGFVDDGRPGLLYTTFRCIWVCGLQSACGGQGVESKRKERAGIVYIQLKPTSWPGLSFAWWRFERAHAPPTSKQDCVRGKRPREYGGRERTRKKRHATRRATVRPRCLRSVSCFVYTHVKSSCGARSLSLSLSTPPSRHPACGLLPITHE